MYSYTKCTTHEPLTSENNLVKTCRELSLLFFVTKPSSV